MALSKRLRFEILNRDGHTCRYCGGQPPDVVLTVDHVLPTALGGADDPSNLCAACRDCNAGKSSVKPGGPVVEQVARDAERWARAIALVSTDYDCRASDADSELEQFDYEWLLWHSNFDGKPLPRPDDWRESVVAWLGRGLTMEAIIRHIPKAMGARLKGGPDAAWRYFCGINWNVITQFDEQATSMVREMEDMADLAHIGDVAALVF